MTASRPRAAQLQLVLEHEHAAVGDAELHARSRRRQRLHERSAYGAPLAPLTPTKTVDGGVWVMASLPGAGAGRRSSVDGAGVALATLAALRAGATVAVALHADAAAAVHVVRVVGDEGAAVRQLHAVAGDAERAAVALGAEARRREWPCSGASTASRTGCGICRPWHLMQLSLPWHLTHFSGWSSA